jgi:hypothetical protein
MLSFRFVMIQSDPETTTITMSRPNASASTLLVLSGSGDVEEKDQVNTHLSYGEHGEAERDAGRPEQGRVGRPERRRGEYHGEKQSDRVDEYAGRRRRIRGGRR